MSRYSLRASFAGTWVKCWGAPKMAALYPEEPTPESREGEAAHWVAAQFARGQAVRVGALAPNGETVTDEMLEGADMMIDTLEARAPLGVWHIEEELPAPDIHEQCGGSPDYWALTHENGRVILHVADYKYGHGFVEVFENWQLLTYASAIISHLVSTGVLGPGYEDGLDIELTVVQPRNYHRDGPVRSWRVPVLHLRAQFNILLASAREATRPEPRLAVGPHCKYCPARHACETLQRASLEACDTAGAAIPFDLTPAQIGGELRRLKYAQALLEARVDGLEVEALTKIRAGQPVPHFAAVQGKGRERWKAGAGAEVIEIAGLLGIDIAKPREPITPKQAIKAGIDATVISAYSEIPAGEVKLVAVDTSTTRKLFGVTTP